MGSIRELIEALMIFARHADEGLDEEGFLQGEHDEIYVFIEIPRKSKDHSRLIALGWELNELGTWRRGT